MCIRDRNETGLIGLAAFLAFLLGAAWLLCKELRGEKGDLLAPSLLACWIMMNLHGLMEISFSVRMYQCAAFTLLLLAVVAYQEPVPGCLLYTSFYLANSIFAIITQQNEMDYQIKVKYL